MDTGVPEVGGRHIAPVRGLGICMRRSNLQTVGSEVPYLGTYQMHGHKCCECSNYMDKCVHCNIVSKSEKLEATVKSKQQSAVQWLRRMRSIYMP